MKYKIVRGGNGAEVEEKVNDLMGAGWELHGSLHVTGDDGVYFAQAMIFRGGKIMCAGYCNQVFHADEIPSGMCQPCEARERHEMAEWERKGHQRA